MIGLGAIVTGIQVVDEENENLDHDYEEVLLGNMLVDEEEAPSDSKATMKPEEMPDRKSGVTFGGLYIEEDHPIEDEIVYMTAMKVPNNNGTSQEDEVIADDLLKLVKDNYEVWGSGAKTRPAGPTAAQLKAQSCLSPKKEMTNNVKFENLCLLKGIKNLEPHISYHMILRLKL